MNKKEYIQYSKRLTRWAIVLLAFVMIACLTIVAFCNIPQYSVQAVVSLFTTFSTVLGITVGAYQGNSTLEKYSRAKYQYDALLQNEEDEAQG